jgi:hypothetical protein
MGLTADDFRFGKSSSHVPFPIPFFAKQSSPPFRKKSNPLRSPSSDQIRTPPPPNKLGHAQQLMRSLRGVLIPLVLLAGLAFRVDDGGAALLPLPPPALPASPSRLALPGGTPKDDGAAASRSTEVVTAGVRSTEIVAPVGPKKQSLRELLVRPQPARHEPSSLVSGEAKAETR